MPHSGDDLVILCENLFQCLNVFHGDNGSHSLCRVPGKLHLMIVDMLVKPELTGHNNRRLSVIKLAGLPWVIGIGPLPLIVPVELRPSLELPSSAGTG